MLKRFIRCALASLVLVAAAAHAQTIAQWTFESTGVTGTTGTDFTYGAADTGIQTAGSSETGHHASSSTVWSFAQGAASARGLSAEHWGVGDYFQFTLSTAGYANLVLSWDQIGSATGPRDFKLAYSTDGTNFIDFQTYTVTTQTWSTSSAPAGSHYSLNLSGVTALNNQPSVYFRLVDISMTSIGTAGTPGTVGTAGTSRLDNFTVTAVPEAGSWAMIASGSALLLGLQLARRRRA